MKNNNLWRIIWIVGIYALLVSILYLVIVYKVKWENKDLNKYLYFYNCSNSLCSTSDKLQGSYYSKILCDNDVCPYIENINNNLLILKNNDKSFIYDYLDEKIISNNYLQYKYLNDNYYIIVDEFGKQGIMDISGVVVVNPEYTSIGDYNEKYLVYLDNDSNLYKIKDMTTGNDLSVSYEKIILINDKLYGYILDNKYYVSSYDSLPSESDTSYDYLYVLNDIILTINDKKIDIINYDLKSTLVMTIPTFYEYRAGQERDSLNIYEDNDIMYFNVFLEDNKYITYRYDLRNKKIL